MLEYRRATQKDIEKLWSKSISESKIEQEKIKFINWKNECVKYNEDSTRVVFVVVSKNEPIGQLSLIFDSDIISQYPNKTLLCNESSAYLAKCVIQKEYRKQGHFSKLLKIAENYAKVKKVKYITLAVYEQEKNTIEIYNHLGYKELIDEDIKQDMKCLYFRKKL